MLINIRSVRLLIDNSCPSDELASACEFIISSKVEPIVREVAIQAKNQMNGKFKKFVKSSGKILGLASLGFLDFGKGIYDASKETVNLLTGSTSGDKVPMGNIIQFITKIKRQTKKV